VFRFQQFWSAIRAGFVLAFLLFVASASNAEIRLVRQIKFGSKQLQWKFGNVLSKFGVQAHALTASGDFLYFSPRSNGVWELYRIRDWSEDKPTVDLLQLPGYFSSDDADDLDELDAQIFVTPDGSFAVCAGSARWQKRSNGRVVGDARSDNIISVIDLAAFKAVNFTHTTDFNLLEIQEVGMDAEGRIRVSSFSGPSEEKERGEFVQLDIPSLHAGPKCIYDISYHVSERETPEAITVNECAQDLHSMSLRDYNESFIKQFPAISSGYVCNVTKAEDCPQTLDFTPDKQFGIGMDENGHDDFLGGWVTTRLTAVLFSAKTHREIGAIDMRHNPPYIELTTVKGKDYLLWLKNGSELAVYRLLD
jgi:hypothetical protein